MACCYPGVEDLCDDCIAQVLADDDGEVFLWCRKYGRGMMVQPPPCLELGIPMKEESE